MRAPREAAPVRQEHLTAPQAAIRAVPQAIIGNTQRGASHAVLHQAAYHVRMVVLHGDPLHGSAAFHDLHGDAGGQVIGMHIVGDDLRSHREQPLVQGEGLPEMRERLQVLQVTEMLAQVRALPGQQAECTLQVGSAR